MSDTSAQLETVPQHVAIVMDGNGRWAKQRGLPRVAGHRAGTENIRNIVRGAVDYGVKYLTLYAFSTENWTRPDAEVQGLMRIMGEMIASEVPELHKEGVQIRHLGSFENVQSGLVRAISNAVETTKNNDRLTLSVAFNYGGRAEIVEAVRAIAREGVAPDAITEDMISNHLYTAGMPNVDLIIRTAGEKRLSNYLLWQAYYAEYYFTDTFWPDFDRNSFYDALVDYSRRKRKFGKTEDQIVTRDS